MMFGTGTVEFKITFTTRCSGNCITCLNPQIENHYVLERELFESIIKQIMELDIPNKKLVSFYSIGESYLHPVFIEMCEWAIPLLHARDINTMIVTNGSHVHNIPKGIDTFVISFNAGKKETYEKVTGMRYDLVCGNIKDLYQKGEFDKANDVQIHMLCFDDNENEETLFLNQFKYLKNTKYRFRYGYDNQYESTNNKGRSQQYSQKISRVPCSYVTNIVTIYPNGDVVRCCHDFFDKYSYGNLKDKSLLDIISSDERKQIYDEHLAGIYNDICKKCDLNRSTLADEIIYGYFDDQCNKNFEFQKKHKGDYYAQLSQSKELLNAIKTKSIMLWGLGKRGQAFEKLCSDNEITITYRYDVKSGESKNLETFLSNCGLIVASNFKIYSMIMYLYPEIINKTINLEKYCPI